jgi:hypothetical protein
MTLSTLDPGERVPILPKSRDGVYPRCVYCCGEIYAPAVPAYSVGEIACAAVRGCGWKLPPSYVTLTGG